MATISCPAYSQRQKTENRKQALPYKNPCGRSPSQASQVWQLTHNTKDEMACVACEGRDREWESISISLDSQLSLTLEFLLINLSILIDI